MKDLRSSFDLRRQNALAAGIIFAATLLAYSRSFNLPFVFDDRPAIVENESITRLATALMPPADGSGVMGRPIVNLSFALNRIVGGLDVRGYHAVNLLLHIASALLLFGWVRRTLLRMEDRPRLQQAAAPVAFGVALLWSVHPLDTESVLCVVQRTELLLGFFYLLVLYAFTRAAEAGASNRWAVVAVAACALGMASKEAMVSAPLIVLLYDRTFFAGSWRAAWQQRRSLHLALAATWVVLAAWLLVNGGTRGDAAGFGLGVTWWEYALKQCAALVHYLWLAIWPHPLVLDYGIDVVTSLRAVMPQALLLLGLIGAAAYATWRRSPLGFFAMFALAILAPSSSVVPLITQTMAEHRMYLPLAALLVLMAIVLEGVVGTRIRLLFVVAALAAMVTTLRRSDDYRSAFALWNDTTAKCPQNPRAHYELSICLRDAGRMAEAAEQVEISIKLYPANLKASALLGVLRVKQGNLAEAIPLLLKYPQDADVQNELGYAMLGLGRTAEALVCFRRALRLEPRNPVALNRLGLALMSTGHAEEGKRSFEAAVRAKPDYAEARSNLGNAWLQAGRAEEAKVQYLAALRVRPDYFGAHNNLGLALSQLGDATGAMQHFDEAVRLKPDFVAAHNNLGEMLLKRGDLPAAKMHFETALRYDPNSASARANLARISGR